MQRIRVSQTLFSSETSQGPKLSSLSISVGPDHYRADKAVSTGQTPAMFELCVLPEEYMIPPYRITFEISSGTYVNRMWRIGLYVRSVVF
jgi:hypothetical protein